MRAGFTLIELLVVIAIIAILAAILFPVFAKVREKARQISCLSNEKQLGLAYIQYEQDYDEFLPCGTNSGQGWAGQLYPYLKSSGVYTCPDDTTQPFTGNMVLSYGENFNLQYQNRTYGAVSIPQANAPASTILLFEIQNNQLQIPPTGENSSIVSDGCFANGGGALVTGRLAASWPVGSPSPTGLEQDTARHTNGANWLFMDGHAKFLRGPQVSNGIDLGNSEYPGDKACWAVSAGTDNLSAGSYAATFSLH